MPFDKRYIFLRLYIPRNIILLFRAVQAWRHALPHLFRGWSTVCEFFQLSILPVLSLSFFLSLPLLSYSLSYTYTYTYIYQASEPEQLTQGRDSRNWRDIHSPSIANEREKRTVSSFKTLTHTRFFAKFCFEPYYFLLLYLHARSLESFIIDCVRRNGPYNCHLF